MNNPRIDSKGLTLVWWGTVETLQKIVSSGGKLTPMMEQYYTIKKDYPNTLLLFRMGDFFELFFEDALKAAKLLGIALTHRGKLCGVPIPMAGIPHHAASNYIDRLTSRGLKVAICEQVQNPKDAIGIVKRAVTQVVGPAMPYDLEKTDGREHHFLAAAAWDGTRYSLVSLDFTTGKFSGHQPKDPQDFLDRLRHYHPREFLTYRGQWKEHPQLEGILTDILAEQHTLVTNLAEDYFSPKFCAPYIEKLIPGAAQDEIIGQNAAILSPIGALSYYICSTQGIEDFVHIDLFRLESEKGKMRTTHSTLQGLEIIPKSKEKSRESLLGFFDKTKTALGSRNLRTIFLSPLSCPRELTQRYDFVEALLKNPGLLEDIREHLGKIFDLERILAKISTQKITARDLIHLAQALESGVATCELLETIENRLLEKLSQGEKEELGKLTATIKKTLNTETAASLEKGNLITEGVHPRRDHLASLGKNAHCALLNLETKYRKKTNISNLKFKSNNFAGFFIEVSKSHLSKVPESFIRCQTLRNSERYTTEELSVFEKDILSAKEKLEHLEREIFNGIVAQVTGHSAIVIKLSRIIGTLDVFQSFAWVASREGFTRPGLTEEKLIHIEEAHHPLIKSTLKDQFVTHDLQLDKDHFFGLITGPNMAGKTTVMREVAIIQFLAQVGSFVPASYANLGLCDHLFSRLGASDDILKGQSTFMVEMSETAEILRHATDRSLIILDEVGRGTSTYDGMSIAWALIEHFVWKTKAITLFATHYHELIDLVDNLPSAKNFTVETANEGHEVRFLYRLIEGGAAQSYGIYVAKLAGLPSSILKRSREILHSLEEKGHHHSSNLPPLSSLPPSGDAQAAVAVKHH